MASNRPSAGDLKGFDDDDIEELARWGGDRGVLVKTLRELRLLDGGVRKSRIHDWKDHQPWLAHADERKAHASKAASARWANKHSSRVIPRGRGADGVTMPGASSQDASRNAPSPDPDPKPDPTREGEETACAPRTTAASSPGEFALDERLRDFARKMGCDPDREFEAFRDYCSAHGKNYSNYRAAFKGWIRKTGGFGRAPGREGVEPRHRGCSHRGCAHLPDGACKYREEPGS